MLYHGIGFALLLRYKSYNWGGDIMRPQEIKAIAKTNGVRVDNMKKENIIKAIQRTEGNTDCFATGKANECGQTNCLWRQDCVTY